MRWGSRPIEAATSDGVSRHALALKPGHYRIIAQDENGDETIMLSVPERLRWAEVSLAVDLARESN